MAKVRSSAPAPPYAAIALFWPGEERGSLLSDKSDKVVVFDTALQAKEFLPLLGNGRLCSYKDAATREEAYFSPLETGQPNRAVVITDYDVYNLPPNHPVPSEARHLGWKHHAIWSDYLRECRGEARQVSAAPSAVGMGRR